MALRGATRGAHTVYVTRNWSTYVFSRDQVTDPLVLRNGASPLAMWYAHPAFGCERLLGTMSPGGCANEGVGTLVYNWLIRPCAEVVAPRRLLVRGAPLLEVPFGLLDDEVLGHNRAGARWRRGRPQGARQ